MKFKKRNIALFTAAITFLCTGTAAFAAEAFNIESVNDRNVVIGMNDEKEADGIAKISFDMGETWESQNKYVLFENPEDYWTYEEYKAYAETMVNDLTNLYAAGEPGLTEEDIQDCKKDAVQMLAFIKSGGKVSKNAIGTDSEIMISGLDGSIIESITEKK